MKNSVYKILENSEFNCSIRYDHNMVTLNKFKCLYYENDIKNATHVHSKNEMGIVFCTEPEIAAALYVNSTIYGPQKAVILNDLKTWLPTVAVDDLCIDLIPFKDSAYYNPIGNIVSVNSDLHPSLCLIFLYGHDRVNVYDTDPDRVRALYYTYSTDDDDLNFDRDLAKTNNSDQQYSVGYIDKELRKKLKLHSAYFQCCNTTGADNFEIMVKQRRQRSRSPGSRQRSPSRNKTVKKTKRRRSHSPRVGNRKRSPSRRRSRSRSRS
ncbi:MAG: hypothetical protein ACRYE7_02290 [Janthinobacterium lividum]